MTRIIHGIKYTTETATKLAEHQFGMGGDFDFVRERLYRTPKGALFVTGEGGPRTKYGVCVAPNEWSGGSEIRPVTDAEALAWCEEHGEHSVIEQQFGHLITEA